MLQKQQKTHPFPANASVADQRRWLVEEMRAAGLPNRTIARVIRSDLDESWDKRFEQFRGDARQMSALQLERERDIDAQIRAALGEDGYRQWDQENMLREANIGKVPLAASESSAIYDMKKKLQQQQWELEQARLDGKMDDAEINAAQSKSYNEYTEQMKALLGDERYAKSMLMDAGTAAANLKDDLAKVNPTDAQFQELLKAQQQFNDSRAALDKQFESDPSSQAYAEQLRALNDARDQEYQRVLGTNVFDTLQKQQDGGYAKMKQYQSIWGLDDSKIDYVYGTMKFYEKSVQDYQAQARALQAHGQNVDWDEVNKNLKQFAQQTQQSLETYLGPASFQRMQQNGLFQFSNPLPQHAPPH